MYSIVSKVLCQKDISLVGLGVVDKVITMFVSLFFLHSSRYSILGYKKEEKHKLTRMKSQ